MTAIIFCAPKCLFKALCTQRSHYVVKKIQRPLSSSTRFRSRTDETQSTISSSHVEKFSTYEWWNETGPLKGLHAMNEIRVPFIRDGLVPCTPEDRNMPLKGKKILDVGCGAGILSESLARIGAEVTGIDANKKLVEVAKHHSNENDKLPIKPTYNFSTIEEHAAHFANYYDSVVASEVIEHINNKELFVKSCVNVCKPGGRIFVTTPTRTRLTQVLGIWIAEYVLNAIPKGTHEYNMMVTPTELNSLLEKNDCHVEIVHGMLYNPFTIRYSFMDSQKLMFAMQAVKCLKN